ncbi:MAG: response regulator [Elusimicrobia bacterium]|nr:response regulator [Elusimicrobiota bacterium]
MPKKILVVEDNEKNMTLLRDILTYHKYEVLEAQDGQTAIKIAREQKPDLILMDIQMPVLDGFTAAKILKNEAQTKDIKIIGITSFAMKGDKEKILEAGFDDYIPKPIDTRLLPELVKKYLA